MDRPRFALILAASFPAPRGSQRYFASQARALQDAGCEIALFTHGHGDGRDPGPFEIHRASKTLSPSGLGSEFSLRRLVAHASLGARLFQEHRRRPFDAILAHNAEAAAIALATRPLMGRPVLYVAHTLWEKELPSYLPSNLRWLAVRVGRLIDREVSRRSDATQTLTEAAARRLSDDNTRTVRAVVPGYPPGDRPKNIPEVCDRYGITPEQFVLYPGNGDCYQNLELLDQAAAQFDEVPVVVASQDPPNSALRHLRWIQVDTPEEARSLIFASGLIAVPRRIIGGFPIKLLEAMEASRAIVALEGMADSLEHGESGWLLGTACDAAEFAAALRDLWQQPERRKQLGKAARARLEERHDPREQLERTRELIPRERQP